jgi:hypothetical protein
MKTLNLVVVAALLAGSMVFCPAQAHAYSFYWSKVEVQTKSWQTCMNLAYGVAQRYNLAQLKRTELAITGSRSGADATITCIGTGGNLKAMAVVMVVGEADGPVKQLRDDLAGAVSKEIMID